MGLSGKVLYSVISSLLASGSCRGIVLSHLWILPMQFYIRGRVPPLCLTSSVPANYIQNPQTVVAFGVLLRMLKCQILLLPTCFGHVSLNNTSQKSENFMGGERKPCSKWNVYWVREFCTCGNIPHGFISLGTYLKTEFKVFNLTLPAMKARSAPIFSFWFVYELSRSGIYCLFDSNFTVL